MMATFDISGFTEREREIVLLLANEGLTNKQIAMRLDVVEATVKVHLRSIIKAMDVENRTQVALKFHNRLKQARSRRTSA